MRLLVSTASSPRKCIHGPHRFLPAYAHVDVLFRSDSSAALLLLAFEAGAPLLCTNGAERSGARDGYP